jgi:hypothetical protein
MQVNRKCASTKLHFVDSAVEYGYNYQMASLDRADILGMQSHSQKLMSEILEL